MHLTHSSSLTLAFGGRWERGKSPFSTSWLRWSHQGSGHQGTLPFPLHLELYKRTTSAYINGEISLLCYSSSRPYNDTWPMITLCSDLSIRLCLSLKVRCAEQVQLQTAIWKPHCQRPECPFFPIFDLSSKIHNFFFSSKFENRDTPRKWVRCEAQRKRFPWTEKILLKSLTPS